MEEGGEVGSIESQPGNDQEEGGDHVDSALGNHRPEEPGEGESRIALHGGAAPEIPEPWDRHIDRIAALDVEDGGAQSRAHPLTSKRLHLEVPTEGTEEYGDRSEEAGEGDDLPPYVTRERGPDHLEVHLTIEQHDEQPTEEEREDDPETLV